MNRNLVFRTLSYTAFAIAATMLIAPPFTMGQQELTRKVEMKIVPSYPAIARRMNITGTVKLMVDVSPDGTVKNVKAIGGHPLLVAAAEDAVKKWKFAPATQVTTGKIELVFNPEL